MKRIFALLLIFGMLCGCLSGCAAGEEEPYVPTGGAMLLDGQDPEDLMPPEEVEETLTLAYNPEMSLNPLIAYSQNNRVLTSLMYQGLFAVSSDYQAYPILCSSFRVEPSGMIWTFYVDKNATFSDGSKVTVEDVLASYNAARQSDYYKGRFNYYVAEIKASSDGEGVSFFLNTPYENLPLLLDVPIVKAEDVEAAHPRGTGPYIYFEGSEGPTLNRLEHWWGGVEVPTKAKVVNLIEAKTPAQVRDEFEFGDVGLVVANPLSDSYADFRSDFELWNIDSGVMLYLGCNILYSDYFEDGKLRTVLTYAIDRDTIIEENYHDHALASTLATSPNSIHYNPALAEKYAFDPLKFIDFISGWNIPTDKDNPNREMVLLVNSDDSARLRTARDIAATLTEYGLPTATLECSGNNYVDVLKANNWDIYLGQTRLPPNQDLSEFFRLWGNLSWGGLPNENILELCKDSLENSGNNYNLLAKLADDGRIIPILFGQHAVYAERGAFTNLNPARDNAFFYTMGRTMNEIQIDTVYN